jgi:PPOX class probable F420-dependent enzyme
MIDFSTKLGRRVARQLESERMLWLTTIGPDNTPQPRPVWFHWDGSVFLIYSRPNAHKIGHISLNAKVALHFNSDREGDEVAVFIGEARLDPDTPPANEHTEYLAKYEGGIADLDMNNEEFAQEYTTAIIITPLKLRGF